MIPKDDRLYSLPIIQCFSLIVASAIVLMGGNGMTSPGPSAERSRWQHHVDALGGEENPATDLVPINPLGPDEFPANPLEINVPDPLLPDPKQPLSQADRDQLVSDLDRLNLEANHNLQLGNGIQAFDIWNRVIRLNRALGPQAEIAELGKVGSIAWEKNQPTEVRYITERLETLHKQVESNPQDPDRTVLLTALGTSFKLVRDRDAALMVYGEILTDARAQQDAKTEEDTLNTIAEIDLNWFDYPQAVDTYQQLLALAQKNGDQLKQINYLKQLAYIHTQARQPQQALEANLALASIYLDQKQFQLIPALQLEIAGEYETLNQLNQSAKTYQDAYSLAWSTQQFNYAGEALLKLAILYRSHNQINAALQVYRVLLDVDQRAYDVYGLMNTYDQIGQIYQARQAYPQARAAFENGLKLAKQLGYREDYFSKQIQQVDQAPTP